MKLGDVVRLKSGGPRMTISEKANNGGWVCHWFLNGQVQRAIFLDHDLGDPSDSGDGFTFKS